MSLQPSFGKIFTFFNMRTVYITSLLIFELGSIICALAPNSVAFIIGRAIAGIGASGMFSGMLAIMRHTVTMRKRPLVMSITGSVYAVSSVLGPLLGGLLTDSRLTWRFCFWLNLRKLNILLNASRDGVDHFFFSFWCYCHRNYCMDLQASDSWREYDFSPET